MAFSKRGFYFRELAQEKLKQGAYAEADNLYQQAFADLDQAIRLGPQFPVVYNFRGLVRHHLRDETGALEDYTKAIEKDPAFQGAYINRCSQYGDMGRLDLALDDCRQAIELGPDIPESYNNIGMVYVKKRQLDLALKNFDRALALNPRYEVADANRSAVLQEIEEENKRERYLMTGPDR